MLALLLTVATATTILEGGSSKTDTSSPVEKVVKLLTDMQKTLEAEAKTDEENFEKLSCWCETTDTEKTQAIADAEAMIMDLTAEIERREKKAEKLTGGIKAATADIEKAQSSLDSAEAQRAKDMEKNHDEEVDLTKNVASLKGAIIVLSKHQGPQDQKNTKKWQQGNAVADSMMQGKLRLNFLQDPGIDRLSAWMDEHAFKAVDEKEVEHNVQHFMSRSAHMSQGLTHDELAVLVQAQSLVKAFVQSEGKHTPGYNNQSGEIFGILTQLKEQLEADLKECQEREAKQATGFSDLAASLKEQLAISEGMVNTKMGQASENTKALADAKESLEDTEKSLTVDQRFLKELKAMCVKMDEQWLIRKKTRQDEIAAVSEALGMLTNDEAKDHMSKTFSFVQVSADSTRKRMVKALKAAYQKTHNPLLLQLVESAQLDGFVKVKAAIDDMISALTQQQSDEVKHKDFCNAELQKNEMEAMAKDNEKADLETKIETLGSTIETLSTEIAAAKKNLANVKVAVQRASMDRVGESKEFQAAIEEQRATRDILGKVKARLNKFYANQNALLQQTPQEEEYKKTHVVPPVKFEEYKASGGASPVITLLDNLITDAMKLEVESVDGENEAAADYRQFIADSNDSMGALEREIVNKSALKAEAEKNLEQANADLKAAVEDLEALAKYRGDLHTACDFVLKNFDARQQARSDEIDALKQAKGILSGSSEA